MRPKHYSGPADTLDMLAGMGPEFIVGFAAGNVFKYVHRSGRKDGESVKSDLDKANFYLELLRAVKWWVEEVGGELERPSVIVERWRRHVGGKKVGGGSTGTRKKILAGTRRGKVSSGCNRGD